MTLQEFSDRLQELCSKGFSQNEIVTLLEKKNR